MNTTFQHANPTKISISLADECDREVIYTIHHGIYARELGQHIENHSGRLTDKLDVINIYIVAKIGDQIAGFVSITPPSGYSIDKFFAQEELPLTFDHRLYQTRILSIAEPRRSSRVAALLMYAALRYIQVKDVETIVGMGQLELLDMYKHAGFESLQRRVRSGNVTLVKDVTGVSHHSFTRFFFPKLLPIFYPFFINLFDFGTPAWAYLVSSLIQALYVSRD